MTDNKEDRVKELMNELQHKNNGRQVSIYHRRVDKGVYEAIVQSLDETFKGRGKTPDDAKVEHLLRH